MKTSFAPGSSVVEEVSINSTSEEVRRKNHCSIFGAKLFPLIQLPRKSEVLPGTFETEEWTSRFPLIQLPRKSEVLSWKSTSLLLNQFPLIQLPRKSEDKEDVVDTAEVYSFH